MLFINSTLCFFIRAQVAESGPPLGTVLGNLGLNAAKFVSDFNDFTKELPSYFLLKVYIYILEDRSFKFSVFLPSTGFILTFIKSQKVVNNFFKQSLFNYVNLQDVVQLALLKFPYLSLKKSLPMIIGSAHSCNIFVVLSVVK